MTLFQLNSAHTIHSSDCRLFLIVGRLPKITSNGDNLFILTRTVLVGSHVLISLQLNADKHDTVSDGGQGSLSCTEEKKEPSFV